MGCPASLGTVVTAAGRALPHPPFVELQGRIAQGTAGARFRGSGARCGVRALPAARTDLACRASPRSARGFRWLWPLGEGGTAGRTPHRGGQCQSGEPGRGSDSRSDPRGRTAAFVTAIPAAANGCAVTLEATPAATSAGSRGRAMQGVRLVFGRRRVGD